MHTNTSYCEGCEKKLAGVVPELVAFAYAFRASHPDGHISCGYRGEKDQEDDYNRRVSRAHFGQSPHNYGAALDWFRLTAAAGASFDKWWYEGTLAPAIASEGLVWGGTFTTITDMPHVETKDWKKLVP